MMTVELVIWCTRNLGIGIFIKANYLHEVFEILSGVQLSEEILFILLILAATVFVFSLY